MIKRVLVVFVLGVCLSSCGNDKFNTDLQRENVDGIECITVRNHTSGLVRAIDCNWGNQ